MGVMDKMLGKWTIIPECSENFDAFAAAMKFTPELTAKMKDDQKNLTVELKKDGDVYTLVSDVNGQVETLTFKLGQEFTSKAFHVETKNVFEEDGDVLVGKHTVSGQETTSRRVLKDGQLIVEMTGNGVTTKNVLKQC